MTKIQPKPFPVIVKPRCASGNPFPTRMSPQNKDNDPLVAVTESESSSYDESQANHEEAGEEVNEKNTTETTYNVGDHVYTWVSFMGVPFATQQHGIVVDLEESHIILVRFQKEEAEEGDDETRNFNMIKERISRIDGIKKWHKIPYGVNWVKRMITRAGTANPIKADDPAMILRRVGWLWKNQFLLLQNLAGETNEKDISECIAVWCMTGNFFSYHGMAKMGHHGADMATGAKLAGSVCTQAAVTTVVPLMLPVFAAYDITTAVQSWKETSKCKNEWSAISKEWNEKFAFAQHLQQNERISAIASLYSPPKSVFPPIVG